MGKLITTFESDRTNNYCEVHMDMKEEFAYIKFYNADNDKMKIEEFRGKSLGYVEDAAENWALGIKKVSGIL